MAEAVVGPMSWGWYCETCSEGGGPYADQVEAHEDASDHDDTNAHQMNEVHESRSSRRG